MDYISLEEFRLGMEDERNDHYGTLRRLLSHFGMVDNEPLIEQTLAEIVMSHLQKDPNYYTRLKKVGL